VKRPLLILFFILQVSTLRAAGFLEVSDHDSGVIVDNKQNVFRPYLKRRTAMGLLFGIQMENYDPAEYKSLLLNQKFGDFTGGATVPLISGELGLKYNFSMGSVAALASYGMGQYSDAVAGLNDFSLTVTKFSANFTMDALMNEPFVAPYIQGGMHKFQVTEDSTSDTTTGSESPETTWNFDYRVGLLFQLNWIEKSIDPNSHIEGLRSSGLQNTYIDIFYASYAQPSEVAEEEGQSGEPDLASSHIGFGLKMEF
jgi:hypothetical protein